MTWLLWLGFALGVMALAAVGLTAWGGRRWARAVKVLQAGLEAGRVDGTATGTPLSTRFHSRELQGLPAPVQRYFRAALTEGQPVITAVTLGVAGTFNMSATGEQWKTFTSRQRVVTHRAGFLWDARIAMLPGVTVRVVDSYIAGKGLLRAAMQGLYTVADQRGDGEIARGELMRFFAEAAWYPTALLPSQGVRWEAVDEQSANATIADGPLVLTLLFRFNGDGLIGSFRAEARGGMVGDAMVTAPWEGRWSHHQRYEGMVVPFTGEVAWVRAAGRRPYFVGAVTSLRYEFAQGG